MEIRERFSEIIALDRGDHKFLDELSLQKLKSPHALSAPRGWNKFHIGVHFSPCIADAASTIE
jgi:hypothetical protein